MPLDELAARGTALLAAIRAVHARGLVHRDLKPENVFMSAIREGRCVARVFDFGLVESVAGLRDRARGGSESTNTGEIVGTPEYMAPEQCEPGIEIDARIDVYALGVMLYEMITGRTPFWGNAAEVQQSHLYRRPPRPSELVPTPAPIEEVVLRCLAKDPERRFESVEALADKFASALARSTGPEPVAAAAATRAPAKKKSANQRRPMAVLVLQGVSDAGRLKGALAAIGGDLAQIGKSSAVAVFGQKTAENPVRRALRAAESLLGRGLAARALLEIATVTVQRRADGSERFVSNAFNKIEQLINDLDPNGVYVTKAVAASADDVRQEPLPDRDVIRVLAPRDDITDSATIMREAAVPLVGRGEVIDQLVASADASLRGGKPTPTIATLIADAGHGKTHFCATMVRALRERIGEVTIVELRAREPMDGDPDRSLRSLLAPLPGPAVDHARRQRPGDPEREARQGVVAAGGDGARLAPARRGAPARARRRARRVARDGRAQRRRGVAPAGGAAPADPDRRRRPVRRPGDHRRDRVRDAGRGGGAAVGLRSGAPGVRERASVVGGALGGTAARRARPAGSAGGDRALPPAAAPGGEHPGPHAGEAGRWHAGQPAVADRARARPQARRLRAPQPEGRGLVPCLRRARAPARSAAGRVARRARARPAAAGPGRARAARVAARLRVLRDGDRGGAHRAGSRRPGCRLPDGSARGHAQVDRDGAPDPAPPRHHRLPPRDGARGGARRDVRGAAWPGAQRRVPLLSRRRRSDVRQRAPAAPGVPRRQGRPRATRPRRCTCNSRSARAVATPTSRPSRSTARRCSFCPRPTTGAA